MKTEEQKETKDQKKQRKLNEARKLTLPMAEQLENVSKELEIKPAPTKKLHVPKFGGATKLRDKAETKALKAGIASSVEGLRSDVQAIGEDLKETDEADMPYRDDIVEAEESIVNAIMAEGVPEALKRDLTVVCMKALVEFYPMSSMGLCRIGDLGLALGYFTVVDEKTKEGGIAIKNGHCVRVFTTGKESGERSLTFLRPAFEGQKDVLAKLKEAVAANAEALKEARQKDVAILRAGTDGTLIDVLTHGGEATSHLDDVEDTNEKTGKSYFIAGGNIRVRVENGMLSAVGVAGKMTRKVNEIMVAGIEIPVSAITQSSRLPRMPEEKFKLAKRLLGIVGQAYRNEKQKLDYVAEVKKWGEENSTASGHDVVVAEKAGKTHLFFKKWETAKKFYPVANIVVERNEKKEIRFVEALEKDLAEELAGCREFVAPGEKFSGVKEPLASMLRFIYGVLSRAARKAAEQTATKAPAPSGEEKSEDEKANEEG